MKIPDPHVRAWYWYAFAAEVFSACALAIFLPITLEHMAREIGFRAPDLVEPCSLDTGPPTDTGNPVVCKARILGSWVDTASFSMYVKSTAVALQALCIISIGPLADSAYWRKRLLVSFASAGALASSIFLVLPGSPKGAFLPLTAALLTLIGNVAYAASIVCANAFLPGLAREDPSVRDAWDDVNGDGEREGDDSEGGGEERGLLEGDDGRGGGVGVGQEEGRGRRHRREARYATILSLTTSRLSSTGTAIGFFSGMTVLALLTVPVTIGHGSTRSLELAVGLCGVWWAVFTVPAWAGLPSGRSAPGPQSERAPEAWLKTAWTRVGHMVRPKEMAELPNLFIYLLAWIFLSDGFHTTTYTAILYASSTLRMSPAKVIIIGLLVQLAAVISSINAPRIQAKLGVSNLRLLVYIVLAAQLLPIYTCLGLILPFGGLRTEAEMYVAAVWFGLLYGPFNSYSRAVYAELIPPGHESTFFSLFSLTDKSASFLGPAIVGLIADVSGNIRFGFLFLLVMLALPVPVLLKVNVRLGVDEARAWAHCREPVSVVTGCSDDGVETISGAAGYAPGDAAGTLGDARQVLEDVMYE